MKSFANLYEVVKIIFDSIRVVQLNRISIPTNRCRTSFHSRHIFRCSRKGIKSHSNFIVMLNLSCSASPMFLSCFIPLGIMATTIMYQYMKITHKIGMRIFNLEVEDLNGLVQFKKTYASDSCRAPVFGVDNIIGRKVSRVYPTFALDLEGMCFGAPDALAVNVKFNQAVDLMDGGRENLLFGRFPCDVVNAGNGIANLNGFDGFLAKLTGTGTSKLYHM